MNLYVMRHGTTVWNEKGITQGRSNNRLSKKGIELTKKSALNFKNQKIDVIITSPLMRTIQTANIVNKYHNAKILKDELLIEIDQGIFTGRISKSLSKEELVLKKTRSKLAKMESYENCFQRAKSFITTIKQKYNYQNVLVITHNCVATFIENILLKKPINFNDAKFLVNFNNAEIKKFQI